MDPKSKLAQTMFNADAVKNLVNDESLRQEKKRGVCWGRTSWQIAGLIEECSIGGQISFFDIHTIIKSSETHKMPGNANKGLKHILEKLRHDIEYRKAVKKREMDSELDRF